MNIILFLSYFILFNSNNAHISMSNPPSRRNPGSSYYNSQGLVNYNLRSPLNVDPDYFTFPCKGFPPGPSVATFNSNKISITLEGTATHGGGHCQFGISYDNRNFLVLRTVLNSCLLDSMTYDFDLPQNAPGGKMTVFWSWVNRVGNREYYMECSDITVNNGNSPDQIRTLRGTELLVVNLPGYQTIPEWNPGDSPEMDGRSLFNSRKEISLTVNGNSNNNNSDNSNNNDNNSVNNNDKLENSIIPIIRIDSSNKVNNNNKTTKKVKNKILKEHVTKITTQCQLGVMKCNNKGFDTCVHGEWIYRNCAPGTACKSFGQSIICDFI